LEDNIVIRPRLSRQTKHTYCEKKAVDREEQHKKLFLFGVLWEEVRCIAKVVDE
jgi:hypothetical protein